MSYFGFLRSAKTPKVSGVLCRYDGSIEEEILDNALISREEGFIIFTQSMHSDENCKFHIDNMHDFTCIDEGQFQWQADNGKLRETYSYTLEDSKDTGYVFKIYSLSFISNKENIETLSTCAVTLNHVVVVDSPHDHTQMTKWEACVTNCRAQLCKSGNDIWLSFHDASKSQSEDLVLMLPLSKSLQLTKYTLNTGVSLTFNGPAPFNTDTHTLNYLKFYCIIDCTSTAAQQKKLFNNKNLDSISEFVNMVQVSQNEIFSDGNDVEMYCVDDDDGLLEYASQDEEEDEEDPFVTHTHTHSAAYVARKEQSHYLHTQPKDNLVVSLHKDSKFKTSIHVMKESDEPGRLEVAGEIGSDKMKYGQTNFATEKSLLNYDGNSLFMIPSNDRSAVVEFDLNCQKTCQVHKTPMVLHDVDVAMGGESRSILLGHNSSAFYRLDTRLHNKAPSSNARTRSQAMKAASEDNNDEMMSCVGKTYTTNQQFTSVGADKDGHIAAANNKGELRLYDGLVSSDRNGLETLGNAKTCHSALGVPFKAIDVSNDGKFIIVTTTSFLVLYDNTTSKGNNCFTYKSERTHRRPPVKLHVSPPLIKKYGITQISFTQARFTHERGGGAPMHVTTSSGNVWFHWDLKKVWAAVSAGKSPPQPSAHREANTILSLTPDPERLNVIATLPTEVIQRRVVK
eukprot:GHVR01128894.1.p1 GENE.GHVR01128894.1~~GHVR01128894.1.p1  ORF type:complete len:680 (+),score=170.91 GHVR01128894.1:18-2057(+)